MTVWGNGSKTQPRMTSKYGPRTGGAFSFHYGTDFSGNAGNDLKAILGGTVTHAGWMNNAAGNAVVIDTRLPDGTVVTICRFHVASVAVRKGDTVSEGAYLGEMGRTGNADGLCDHVEIRFWKNGSYKTVDPVQWIGSRIAAEAKGGTAAGSTNQWPARALYGEAHVRSVQEKANRLGAKLAVDGKDGPATQAWVRGFQKSVGLAVDGIAGPLTVGKMDAKLAPAAAARPVVKRGSKGAHVVALQKQLAANYPLYARNLKADGDFGPATEAAVREFQRRAGLAVDGIVGTQTWARLGL